MSFIVVIPSRYASTRLPGKSLADIAGQPLIAHVVDRANESNADRVVVATDDQRIADALTGKQCDVCMTCEDHASGSDRLAEVVDLLGLDDDEIVLNVQGDEPQIPAKLINRVAECLKKSPDAAMATAAHPLTNHVDIENPNIVKVVFDQSGKALYFSRAPIPYDRDGVTSSAWKHVGIYAYRASFLKRYNALAASEMEQIENLEQLRVLDNGDTIMVEAVDYDAGIGVDTQDDLDKVRQLFS